MSPASFRSVAWSPSRHAAPDGFPLSPRCEPSGALFGMHFEASSQRAVEWAKARLRDFAHAALDVGTSRRKLPILNDDHVGNGEAAFAHPCMGLEESRGNSGLCHLSIFLDQFLGSTEAFLRPDRDLARAPRADAVKPGRRPPPEAARSGLDGVEHGASIAGSGDWSRPEPAT